MLPLSRLQEMIPHEWWSQIIAGILDGWRMFDAICSRESDLSQLCQPLEFWRRIRQPLPLAASAHQLFLAASGAGWGKLDDSAVVKVFETMGGFKVSKA